MSLEESVALDTSEAQSRIDDIGSALTSAAQSFATALDEATQVLSSIRVEQVDASAVTSSIDEAVAAADTSPTVTADASEVTTSIDDAVAAVGTPDVPVTADTSEVASSIDEAVGNASPPPLEVPVDAGEITSSIDSALSSVDTSGLQSELGDVSTAATGAGNAAREAGIGIGSIAPAAALATGEVGSLQEIIGQVTPGMAGAAAATVGLAAAGKDLFDAALQQDTALSRLRQTYGDLADSIEHVNFGGINEDLSTLAVRTGANVDGLRNFAASFGTLGKSAGDSLPHVADVSQQIELLAVRASVLNPNLGTADEIVQRLSTSLSRGGRFLAAYGIALSSADINAEALRETGKATTAELSIYDKEVAGATLATQQLGGALGKDINEGAQKAEVQLRSLKAAFEETLKSAGAPLIQPVIDAFRELEPVLAALASLLGTTLAGALHVVGPLLSGLAAVLGPIADAAKEIPTPVIEAVTAFLLFDKVGGLLAGALDSVVSFATLGGVSFAGFGATAEATAAEVDASAASMEAALGPIAAGFAAVAAPIAIAAAIGAAAGFAFAKLTDDSKELGAGLATLRENFANANKSIDDSVATFARMQIAAQDGKTALADIGVSTGQVADEALHGKSGFEAFLATLVGTGKISQEAADELLRTGESAAALKTQMDHGQSGIKGLDDSAVHLIDTFSRVQTVTADTAHETLTAAVAHGQLTRAQEVTAISAHTAANGTVDWVGVLRQLQPSLAAAGTAAQVFGDKAALTNPVVQKAAEQTKILSDATGQAAVIQLDSLVAQGRLTQGQRDAAEAVHTNAQGVVDYGGVLKEIDPALASQAELQGRVNAGLGDTRSAFQVAADAADAYKTAVDQALGVLVSADEQNIKLHDSIDKVTKALQDSKGSIDLNTDAGRTARKEVDGLASDTTAYIDTLIREGASQATVTAARDEGIKRLQTLEATYPQLKPLIDPYIATLQAIPPDKGTNVHADGTFVATANVQDVQAAVDALHDKGIEVNADTLPAQIALDALIAKFGELEATEIAAVQALSRAGIPLGPLTAGGGPRMAGGPVDPFNVFAVNEQRGDVGELFVPQVPGFIVSQNDALRVLQQLASGQGGGSSLDIGALLKGLERLVQSQRPIQVNQVAQDPEATAFAVSARLGEAATR